MSNRGHWKTRHTNPRVNIAEVLPVFKAKLRAALHKDVDIAEECWEYAESKVFASGAYETRYIQGMQEGDLDPNNYGQYVVEDAIYIMLCVENFRALADRVEDATLKVFFNGRAESYKNYGEAMTSDWHIGDISAIELAPAAKRYAQLQKLLVNSSLPVGYAIASMVPCERLWPDLAQKMASAQASDNKNLYSFWIKDNESNSMKLAKMLNDVYNDQATLGTLDKAKLLQVYACAMNCEQNFFLSGTQRNVPDAVFPEWIESLATSSASSSSFSSEVDSA